MSATCTPRSRIGPPPSRSRTRQSWKRSGSTTAKQMRAERMRPMRPSLTMSRMARWPTVWQVVVGPHLHAGRRAGVHHALPVGDGKRERLLAQHMLACFSGRDGLGTVELVGGADVDRVHVGVGEQRVEIAVGALDAVLARVCIAPFLIAAHDRDDVAVSLGADRVDHPIRRDAGGADQAPADLLCHGSFLTSAVNRSFGVCSARWLPRFVAAGRTPAKRIRPGLPALPRSRQPLHPRAGCVRHGGARRRSRPLHPPSGRR